MLLHFMLIKCDNSGHSALTRMHTMIWVATTKPSALSCWTCNEPVSMQHAHATYLYCSLSGLKSSPGMYDDNQMLCAPGRSTE